MVGKIKKLVEETCPIYVVINGSLYIYADSVGPLLSAIRASDLHISVSLHYSNSCVGYDGLESSICRVIFAYD